MAVNKTVVEVEEERIVDDIAEILFLRNWKVAGEFQKTHRHHEKIKMVVLVMSEIISMSYGATLIS